MQDWSGWIRMLFVGFAKLWAINIAIAAYFRWLRGRPPANSVRFNSQRIIRRPRAGIASPTEFLARDMLDYFCRAAGFALLLAAAFPRTGYSQEKNATDQIALCRTNYERKHYAEAVRSCNEAATQGNAAAQALLGYMYANGVGVKQDYTEAFNWYRKAAAQGNAVAEANLGGIYGSGLGVKEDYGKAFDWSRRAAKQGDAEAQYNLGHMYANGLGVKQDCAEAFNWYRKAAAQGNEGAQAIFGIISGSGQIALCRTYLDRKDYTEAACSCSEAAKQGDADAQDYLGYLYDHGLGVKKDSAHAVNWYRKAAEQGNVDAQLKLAAAYYKGDGVKPDSAEALNWYRKAAAQGNADAKKMLEEISGPDR